MDAIERKVDRMVNNAPQMLFRTLSVRDFWLDMFGTTQVRALVACLSLSLGDDTGTLGGADSIARCYLVAPSLTTKRPSTRPLPRQIVSVERLCNALSTYLPTLPDTEDPAAATAAVTVFKQAVLGFESRRKKDSAAVDPNAMLIDVRNAANLFRYAVLLSVGT